MSNNKQECGIAVKIWVKYHIKMGFGCNTFGIITTLVNSSIDTTLTALSDIEYQSIQFSWICNSNIESSL